MKFLKDRIFLILFIALFSLNCGTAGAAEKNVPVLALEQIIEISLENYPLLKSNRQTINRDKEMSVVERSLDNPQFEIMFDDQSVSSASLGRGMRKNFKISQMLPGPGKRALRGKVALSMSEVSAANMDVNKQNLIRDIKENYYMLFMTRSEKKIVDKSIAILASFMSLIMQRYQLGLASQTDVIKLSLDIEKMKAELIKIKKNDGVFTAKLKSFMNKKENDFFEIDLAMKTGEIKLSAEELFDIARKNNSDINVASKMVDKNQYSVELAGYGRKPDFMVSAQYSNLRGDMQENTWTLMVGASIPLYKKRINSEIKAARAELSSAIEMKNAMENDTFRMISEEMAYVAAQNELVNKYSASIIPSAGTSVQAAMIAYQNSQIDYESLVMAQRELFDFEMENIRAYIEYLVHFNMLERIVGTKIKN